MANLIEPEKSPSYNKSTESVDSLGDKERIQRLINTNADILQITNLCFKESDSQISQPKPTVRCVDHIDVMGLVRDVICNEWILNKPQIVVFMVSNAGPINNWTNARQIKSFQRGLMKAVENTNMWLIANGLDIGLTTIIGEAVTNFMTEAKYKRQVSPEKTYAKFNFIGVVDQKLLKYNKIIAESNRLKTFIGPDQNTISGTENLYELNRNLSHYILVEEKSSGKNSGVNLFLENLTDYLYSLQRADYDLEMNENFIKNTISMASNKDPAEDALKQKQRQANREKAYHLFSYLCETEIPVVSIVVKGGYGCSKLVKNQIQRHVPVVVLKGSGGLADLLAFVDIEIRDRNMDSWDLEFVESYIKPELTIKIMASFPDLRNNTFLCNQFRQTVLDIVRESRESGQNYLTIINMLDVHSCDLENLTEHLLFALFRSQRHIPSAEQQLVIKDKQAKPDSDAKAKEKSDAKAKESKRMILKDLKLCIDWNCPEMAKREVLAKHSNFSLNSNETRKLFEECLIRQNRWQFVDLFLSQKFKLRNYTPKRLRKIFRAIHFNKFYLNVCWESILRRSKDEIWPFIQQDKSLEVKKTSATTVQSKTIWNEYFNDLVYNMTSIRDFYDADEIGRFVTEMWYPLSEREAERKSLELLVLWALFDNRRELVRTFWQHSDQPIQLAIIIAIAYNRLSWYVKEETLTNRLKEESELFVSFACELLDIVYKDSPYRAEEVLNESIKDYNFKTSVDMAAIGKFKRFFSHESVQRWLTLLMNGNIEIKDTKFGFVRMPVMTKLILCAYLVFPAYFWIKPLMFESNFEKDQERLLLEEDDNENEVMNQVQSQVAQSSPSLAPSASSKVSSSISETPDLKKRESSVIKAKEMPSKLGSPNKGQMPCSVIWWSTVVYEVWSAPTFKFWNFQFFYTFYLAMFSLATLYPKCGHFYLDVIIAIWTSLLIVDSIRQAYLMAYRFSRSSVFTRVVQIVFQIFFVIYLVRYRLYENSNDPYEAFQVKVVMSVGLIHAYYVLLTVFLPISATLGPLLYRLKIMIFVDFYNFIRLSILVMISFGIVIQTLYYPDADVTGPIWKKLITRTMVSLFITPTDELQAEDNSLYKSCGDKKWSPEEISNFTKFEDFCSASIYTSPDCPNTGVSVYIFLFAYFILLKLVLLTLLYAIFASSAARLTADTEGIWRFQRYGLVMDFVTRAPLPPPLNIFYYIYWILRFLIAFITDLICNKEKDYFRILKLIRQLYYGPEHNLKTLADEDYSYLRALASEVFERFERRVDGNALAMQHFDRTKINSEELENQRKALRQLKSELCELKRTIRQESTSVESLKHFLDKKSGLETLSRKSLHLLSRHSPYPNTNVQRYPVPDKYVSWDVMFIEYDPPAFTKPKEEFSIDMQEFVDSDILAAKMLEMSGQKIKEMKFDWNRLSGAIEVIDRRSWDMIDKEPLIYKLNENIPINPWGRTGLNGRGALPRWGPNHYVLIVITRIKESNKKQILEVLVEKPKKPSSQRGSVSLIELFIPGVQLYNKIEKLFKVTEDSLKNWKDQEEITPEKADKEKEEKSVKDDKTADLSQLKMVKYFKSFDETKDVQSDPSSDLSPNLKYERLMRGYFDDPLNTDMAWKEVELWHFHYTKQDNVLNEQITEALEWMEVKEMLFYSLSLSQSQVIQMIVDKLKIDIR